MATHASEGGTAREGEGVVIDRIVGPGAMIGRRHGADHVDLDARIGAQCERDRIEGIRARHLHEELSRKRGETGSAAQTVLAPGEKK